MTVGLVMLVVGIASDTTAAPWFGFLIPAGGFFTILGLRGRANALQERASRSRESEQS
jgi:hypothetical protein